LNIETFNTIINDISTTYTEFATYTGEEYRDWPVELTCDPVDVERAGNGRIGRGILKSATSASRTDEGEIMEECILRLRTFTDLIRLRLVKKNSKTQLFLH
jgi:hypothetical protein